MIDLQSVIKNLGSNEKDFDRLIVKYNKLTVEDQEEASHAIATLFYLLTK